MKLRTYFGKMLFRYVNIESRLKLLLTEIRKPNFSKLQMGIKYTLKVQNYLLKKENVFPVSKISKNLAGKELVLLTDFRKRTFNK